MAAPKEKRHLAGWSGFTLLASLVRKANGTQRLDVDLQFL